MKKLKQRGIAVMLLFALIFSGIVVPAKQTQAATEDEYWVYVDGDTVYSAEAGVPYQLPSFTARNANKLYVWIYTTVRVDFNIKLASSGVTTANMNYNAYASDDGWVEIDSSVYCYPLAVQIARNTLYTPTLTFPENTPFLAWVAQDRAYIDPSTVTMTKGFKTTVKLADSTEAVTWSSANTAVATVTQAGVVTGKKAGTTTVTAKTASGKTFSCSVTVKNNTYTRTKPKLSEAPYGDAYVSVTKVSYDSKGNLVIKVTYLNNSGRKITKLNKINIKVKNKNGKVIGTYSLKNKKTTIKQGASKSFTYKIKKSKLKIKSKQDLRQGSVSTKCTCTYRLN